MDNVPITAIVTAYRRIEQTLGTLRRIEACRPPPAEILVHVDGNATACVDAVSIAFPHLNTLLSEAAVGPGGGRNKLVAAARNDVIASFDDDSFPLDADYFARAWEVTKAFPEASVIAATIVHPEEAVASDDKVVITSPGFVSCGVVFKRSAFLATGGFVPLVVAYGMEEEDLALRLIDRGETLLHCPWLRVFHDTDRRHHAEARITAGVIANLALLAWLRYPVRYWPYGLLQLANRVLWSLRVGRRAGILAGLAAIPRHLARHRSLRKPVSKATIRQRFATRSSRPQSFSLESGPLGA